MDFEEIYRTYFNDVFVYIRKLSGDENIAEEITSQTFFKALSSINKFRGECDVRVWLCQIAKNLYYEWYNKNKKTIPLDETFLPYGDGKDIAIDFADKETAWQILQQLHTLDDPYKEVFMLHALGDVSLKEISRLFQKSDSWARVIYYRAKNMIIAKLKEEQK